jgi:hypothetical protein
MTVCWCHWSNALMILYSYFWETAFSIHQWSTWFFFTIQAKFCFLIVWMYTIVMQLSELLPFSFLSKILCAVPVSFHSAQ